MGEGKGHRVVGVVGGGPLCLLLGREIRRKGLPVDLIAVDPAPDCPARPVLQRQIVAALEDCGAILQLAAAADVVIFDAPPPNGAVLEALANSRKPVHPSPETLRALRDAPARKQLLPADVAMELAVIAVRGASGELRSYPAAEKVQETTIVPARIDPATARAAEALALETLQALRGVGVFCVDLVVDRKGTVLVQDVVPQAHPSGDYTIEACRSSQFEQQIRAVTGMPLGDPTLLYSAVSVQILGAPGLQGPVVLEGVDGAQAIPGAFVHLYGRRETAPGRTLGHVTLVDVLDPGYRDALVHRADHVRRMIVQKEARR